LVFLFSFLFDHETKTKNKNKSRKHEKSRDSIAVTTMKHKRGNSMETRERVVLQKFVLLLLLVVATVCWSSSSSSFLTVANAQVLGACTTNCSIPPNTNEPVNQDLRLNPQNYDVMGDVKVLSIIHFGGYLVFSHQSNQKVSNNSMMTMPPGAKFNLQGGKMKMDGKVLFVPEMLSRYEY